jgi:hypothetical protein
MALVNPSFLAVRVLSPLFLGRTRSKRGTYTAFLQGQTQVRACTGGKTILFISVRTLSMLQSRC